VTGRFGCARRRARGSWRPLDENPGQSPCNPGLDCIADFDLRVCAWSGADSGRPCHCDRRAGYEPLAELRGRERFPQGAQLLVVRDGKAVPLVEGFAATADADVSFDGKSVLFAGKQASGDLWQIWELTLENRAVRKVIATATDAERPLYLPGDGWSGRSARRGISTGVRGRRPCACTCAIESDGRPRSASAHLHASQRVSRDVLADGRILFEAGFPSARDRPRSCIWFTPMARALSHTAAITGGRAGAERNWPRATWCSRTEIRWRGSLRRWPTK